MLSDPIFRSVIYLTPISEKATADGRGEEYRVDDAEWAIHIPKRTLQIVFLDFQPKKQRAEKIPQALILIIEIHPIFRVTRARDW
jgi:hypothetical protein